MSSIPTDILTRLSSMPSFFLSSRGTEACVIIAGDSIKLSTPPKDSPQINILKLDKKDLVYSIVPFT